MKLVTELKELKQLNKLTNSEIQVVDYLLDYPQEIAKLSSRQLATLTHTSAATVVRVCQKVGMSGYGEFKLKYLQEISQTPRHINRENPITSNESIHTILNKVAALKMTAIEETKKGIDLDQLTRVAKLLNHSTFIDLYAFDNNLHLAKYAAANFLYAGKNSAIQDGSNAQFMQAMVSGEGHVAMMISRTGENVMLARIAKLLQEKNIPIIMITESKNSTLAGLSTEHLYVYNVHRFSDMGTLLFQTSAEYIFELLFAILFSQNFENSIRQNKRYEEINEYHDLYKKFL